MHRLRHLVLLLLLALPLPAALAVEQIVVSAPGPRNISYLPVDLIPKLGADKAEGFEMQIVNTGGGGVALNNLMTRNADFAVAGVPAAMSLRANGGDVVVVAAVNDAPLFVLMVRADLKGKVKKIADLKGKVIGVNTSTKNSKTTSQQLAEVLLRSGGITPDDVRIVPAGQSWVEQSSLMLSGAADAVMGDEPFASRLLADGKVFFLAHLAMPATVKGIKGTNFLHAAVETRGELARDEPRKVERFVRALRRVLEWMATHKPEEIVARLDIADAEERHALIHSLNKYRLAFSRDGKLSTAQLAETELFFRSTSIGNPAAESLSIESMVNDTWAGRRK